MGGLRAGVFVHAFEQAVAAGLETWPRGTVFLASVSGGADSTAMLAALEVVCRERGFLLRCLHIDHGLRSREECRGDAEAVRNFCKRAHIPLRVVSIFPGKVAETARRQGLGIEGAARFYRRRIWKREARHTGAERILVAHTRDDLLETVLMRILRGSGPEGLAGIVPSRGRIVRPLLGLSRAEVIRYLNDRHIPFRTDSTNADSYYLRNRIRHKLAPLLDEFFPGWKKTLLFFAETQCMIAQFLQRAYQETIDWEPVEPGSFRTGREAFFEAPAILREEALLRGADLLGAVRKKPEYAEAAAFCPDLPRKRIPPPRRAVIRRFAAREEPAADLGPLHVAIKDRFMILSPPPIPQGGEGFSLLIKGPGVYKLKGLVLKVIPCSGWGFSSVEGEGFFARLPLVLRPCEGTDRIGTAGRGRSDAGGILTGRQRGGYTLVITAEDSQGAAAFIGGGRGKFSILSRRERADAGFAGEMFFFTAAAGGTGQGIGGMDV